MSSAEYLREFVNERLTAAAEEIFIVFKKIIFEYEEEIDRQRKLLDIVWKPEIKLHRTELPQQHVCKEEDVFSDQQLCILERNSSLDQEDPEPPQIKEEQEELDISQEGEQLEVKQETETFMMTPTDDDSDHSDDWTPDLNSDDTLNADQNEGKHGDLGSTSNAEPKLKKRYRKSNSLTNNVYNPTMSSIHSCTGKKKFHCDICKKDFNVKSFWLRHLRTHTGEKPYACNQCGRRFSRTSTLNTHKRIHTGEKPFSCTTCGRMFGQASTLNHHKTIHTGEKSHSCTTCGKIFSRKSQLSAHIRVHTGEKPHSCNTCGRQFNRKTQLLDHVRIHTGEMPFFCITCGKTFMWTYQLKAHLCTHTDEKP